MPTILRVRANMKDLRGLTGAFAVISFVITFGILIHHAYIHEGVWFVPSDILDYGFNCHETRAVLFAVVGVVSLILNRVLK